MDCVFQLSLIEKVSCCHLGEDFSPLIFPYTLYKFFSMETLCVRFLLIGCRGASNVQKLFVFFGDGHASVIDWAITKKWFSKLWTLTKIKWKESKTLDRRRVWEGKWDYCEQNWGMYGNWGNDIVGTQGNYGNNINNITFFVTHGNNINSLLVVCFTSSILAHNNIVTNGYFLAKKSLKCQKIVFHGKKNFIW